MILRCVSALFPCACKMLTWKTTQSIVNKFLKIAAEPTPLLFFTCAVSSAMLLAAYARMKKEHTAQKWFLAAVFVLWPIASLATGHSVLTTSITVLPWVVYLALLLSEILDHFLASQQEKEAVLVTFGV
jgi:4-hydroxybenzoate polyprenyltransferase